MALPLRASRTARRVWYTEQQAFVAGARWIPAGAAQAIVHPQTPEVWDANFLARVNPGANAGALVETAHRILLGAGCAHVKIVLEDPYTWQILGPDLEKHGLTRRVFVTMSTRALPPPPPDRRVVVRPVATRSDRKRMSLVRDEVRAEAPWFSPEVSRSLDTWEDLQSRHLDLTWLVAFLDDEPAGVVGVLFTENGASLQSLATIPRLRRQGVATGLIREVVRRGLARGAPWVSLLTDRDDKPRKLYRKLGFREVGEVHEYVRGGL